MLSQNSDIWKRQSDTEIRFEIPTSGSVWSPLSYLLFGFPKKDYCFELVGVEDILLHLIQWRILTHRGAVVGEMPQSWFSNWLITPRSLLIFDKILLLLSSKQLLLIPLHATQPKGTTSDAKPKWSWKHNFSDEKCPQKNVTIKFHCHSVLSFRTFSLSGCYLVELFKVLFDNAQILKHMSTYQKCQVRDHFV